jgi:hypothetical protein
MSASRGVDRAARFGLTPAPLARARRGGLIRFTLRLVGLLLLAGAFAAAVIDGARSLADQKIELSSMGTVLAYASPAKFALMHDYVAKKAPMLWDVVVVNALYAPATLDLAVLGAGLFYLARRRADREALRSRIR